MRALLQLRETEARVVGSSGRWDGELPWTKALGTKVRELREELHEVRKQADDDVIDLDYLEKIENCGIGPSLKALRAIATLLFGKGATVQELLDAIDAPRDLRDAVRAKEVLEARSRRRSSSSIPVAAPLQARPILPQTESPWSSRSEHVSGAGATNEGVENRLFSSLPDSGFGTGRANEEPPKAHSASEPLFSPLTLDGPPPPDVEAPSLESGLHSDDPTIASRVGDDASRNDEPIFRSRTTSAHFDSVRAIVPPPDSPRVSAGASQPHIQQAHPPRRRPEGPAPTNPNRTRESNMNATLAAGTIVIVVGGILIWTLSGGGSPPAPVPVVDPVVQDATLISEDVAARTPKPTCAWCVADVFSYLGRNQRESKVDPIVEAGARKECEESGCVMPVRQNLCDDQTGAACVDRYFALHAKDVIRAREAGFSEPEPTWQAMETCSSCLAQHFTMLSSMLKQDSPVLEESETRARVECWTSTGSCRGVRSDNACRYLSEAACAAYYKREATFDALRAFYQPVRGENLSENYSATGRQTCDQCTADAISGLVADHPDDVEAGERGARSACVESGCRSPRLSSLCRGVTTTECNLRYTALKTAK